MDWEECKLKKIVKEVKEDEALINSLINLSKSKLASGKLLPLNETTSSTKIGIFYESLREILEALAIKKGYKIYNHECFEGFLKEICKEEESSKMFNKFRKARNKINYYGSNFSISETKLLIKEISFLRREILNKYLK